MRGPSESSLIAASYAVAESCLRGPLPQRWRHVRGVANAAKRIGLYFTESDRETLVAAAILHDIGYSPAIAKTNFHPLDGALFLQSVDMPARICSLVAHHSCAHKEAELRGLSYELAKWSDEATALRDALWWADMTTTPDGDITNVHDRIREIRERYGPDDLVSVFIQQAKSELVAAVERTEERLRTAGLGHLVK